MVSSKEILTPIRMLEPQFIKNIYTLYLEGKSIDEIVTILNLEEQYSVTEREVDNVIDQVNELYH